VRLPQRTSLSVLSAVLPVSFLAALLLAGPVLARTPAAIVVDDATGAVLYARNADLQVHPASLTKLMTLYLLFEALEEGRIRLDDQLQVSPHAAAQPPSRLGLRPGQTIPVRDAIRALAVKSANDVAVVVAEALAGSEAAFARRMTEKARRLGMSRTTFGNASGLEHPRQRTTARDMATLARRLVHDFPQYYRFFGERVFRWGGQDYRNHNRLLDRYPGMDGLKTGYIRASGYNLVASAVRDGRRIVAVVIGGPTAGERDHTMAQLLDLGFRTTSPPLLASRIPRSRPEAPFERAGGRQMAKDPGAVSPPPAPRPVQVAAPARESSALRPNVRTARANARPARTPGAAPGAYAVQVGAYRDPKQAYAAARHAMRLLPDPLLAGEIDVSPHQGRRRTLYRARITGFDQDSAIAACRMLRARRNDCLVVQVEQLSVAQR